MAENEEPWDLVVGRVVAPFGIRGRVRVRAETDCPERFRQLREVRLELPDGSERPARISHVRIMPKGIVVQFEGYENRNRAEELRGAFVKIKSSMAMPLPEGAYYIHEIIGMRVGTVDGRDLGEIVEVIRSPAHDVYVTAHAMIPARREVVKEIDREGRRMVVSLPPQDSARAEREA